MRGFASLAAALSAYLSASAALPQLEILPRVAPPNQDREPKYSVVPLEPWNGDSGTGGRGGNDSPANDPVTVVSTVVKADGPVTRFITISADTKTVIKSIPPTTISIVDLRDPVTTTVRVTVMPDVAPKTITVTVDKTSPATPPIVTCTLSSRCLTFCARVTETVVASHPGGVRPANGTLHNSTLSSVATLGGTTTPTTLSTILTTPPVLPPPPSSTYDDGQWHATHSWWNGSLVRRDRS